MNGKFTTECYIKSVTIFSKGSVRGDERIHVEFEPSKEWSIEFGKKRYFILKENTDGDDSDRSHIAAMMLENFSGNFVPTSYCQGLFFPLAKIHKSRVRVVVDETVPMRKKSCGKEFLVTNVTLI